MSSGQARFQPFVGGRKARRPGRPRKAAGRAQSSRLRSARHEARHPPGTRTAAGEKAKQETRLLSAVAFYFSCFRSISHISVSAAEVNGKAASHPGQTTPYTSFRQRGGASQRKTRRPPPPARHLLIPEGLSAEKEYKRFIHSSCNGESLPVKCACPARARYSASPSLRFLIVKMKEGHPWWASG